MRSMYKNELARLMGVSRTTMSNYMKQIEDILPHYSRKQTLLTPDQVKIVCEHFCIDLD